jgi:predicted AlkP superfamily pyrophosphatase or phosphodiesterase
MITRRTLLLLSFALVGSNAFPQAAPPSHTKPKLVIAIAVDQFRYDYTTKFRNEYTGGLQTLLTQGAVFTNARYVHFPTVTAIGHSTFLSGATPSLSGIIANEWFDRETGKKVTSVSDPGVKLLGGNEVPEGSSPHRLLVSTLGDEMKIADPKTKVIGVSLKDRAAILPSGHMADGAYWFDLGTGGFASSTYYFPELPAWVKEYNASHPADKYAGTTWNNKNFDAKPGAALYKAIPASPWGNELVENFAELALQNEQLGTGSSTDLLTVSFSSNDYVGHQLGPDDPAVRDMAIRTDKQLARLFAFVDKRIGLRNVVIVLTADHGVAPKPEVNQARHMPGGRLKAVPAAAIEEVLTKKYGAPASGKWVLSSIEYGIYLDYNVIDAKKLNRAEVAETAADLVRGLPHIFRAYTRDALLRGEIQNDFVGKHVTNGFFAQRAPDVAFFPEPYWIESKTGTTHGTPFGYDTHVPVILMGPGIKTGVFNEEIKPNDIAPTLATLLCVESPSGSIGRALTEAVTEPRASASGN